MGDLRIDEGTEFGGRVARRLRSEVVVWLTTVRRSGMPLPRPVWFLWDGADSVLIYSQHGARLRNLAANGHVSLNFDSNGRGGDIVVLDGVAAEAPEEPAAHSNPEYLAKYASDIKRIGMTPVTFSQRYSVPLRVRITAVRGH